MTAAMVVKSLLSERGRLLIFDNLKHKKENYSLILLKDWTKLISMKNFILGIVLMFFVTSAWAQKYDYDKAGRLVKVTYPSGRKIYYYYDKAGNLVSVTESKKKRKELRAKTNVDHLSMAK